MLGQIAPLEGAASRPLTTFNASGEWDSRDWVTRRVDVLPEQTAASESVRHYRSALRETGWQIDTLHNAGSRGASIWGHRNGRRIKVVIQTESAPRVELDLR